ncbi:hypothetical protein LWI28_023050 [Acer negundo]|uniref:FKBP12-interacting protein of 37 kDa n=1 Tax=Acer negundo TaxID=4023 RepID=A0AAD5IR64_ACENE|nr:hypothetical protein LWI28_023050 [Acer negundo]
MASTHLDDDDDFGGDFAGTHDNRRSGNKRSFGEIEDDEDDIFGSKKANSKAEEAVPGVTTGMILTLRESLETCKNTLATCQSELEAAKLEIQKWHSSFQNEPFIPLGASPEPKLVINYLQTIRSSEEILKEQLEKAKKKEAAFIVTFAKREQEIAELKSAVRDLKAQLKPPLMQARRLLLDPAIHEEFRRLKNLVEEKDKKVKELEENIAAVAFTANSKMGKALMSKCKTLQEENDEIGRQNEEGETHQLQLKLALQKSQNAELRSQFEGLYKHMEALTDDVDRSNEMVLILKEKLEEKDCEIERLKHELHQKSLLEEEEITDSVPDKKITDEVALPEEDKSKKKWFGKQTDIVFNSSAVVETVKTPPPSIPLLQQPEEVNVTEAENEMRNFAPTVAVTTTTAASVHDPVDDASQSVKEVVQITTNTRFQGKLKEEAAAIRIQTAFRGYQSSSLLEPSSMSKKERGQNSSAKLGDDEATFE